MKDSLRLLLSLYACEPERGSEPGVGWAWALGMARRHETWVLTRKNNREKIERALDALEVPPGCRPRFVWVDLPHWVQRLKKIGVVPVSLYYFLWQFAARRAWDRTGINVDVIHHVTFCSYVVPGVWWHRKEKVVLGPLGGTSVCPTPFLREFPLFGRFAEFRRGIGRKLWFLDPFFIASRKSAGAVIFVDRRTAAKMSGRGRMTRLLLDVAVPQSLCTRDRLQTQGRKRQFVWAGTLGGHKAPGVAIRAFAKAFHTGTSDPVRFVVFGSGPLEVRLKKLAASLGVASSVDFRGSVPQDEMWAEIASSLGFVFTSVRDTCGSVSVEALACGTPVVCFKHQGVGEVVDDTCGIAVQPGSYGEAVDDFAAAMLRLVSEQGLSERLGNAGRKRVLENFTWEGKFDEADEIYRRLCCAAFKPLRSPDGGSVG